MKHAVLVLGWPFVLVSLVLSSCQASRTIQGPVTLTVLTYADSAAPGYSAEVKVWDLVKKKTSPWATLEIEELFNEAYHRKIEAYAASGKVPDIVFMWPSGRSATLHSRRLVKDLTPLLGPDYLKDFAAVAVDPKAQAAGYLAELPSGVTASHVMYVNTTILSRLGLKPATSYEDLKSQVPKLKAAGLEAVLMGNKNDWVMQSCLFSTIVGRLAGNDYVKSILQGKADFTDAPFLKALRFVQTLYADGVLSKTTFQIPYEQGPSLFAAGKAAYYIDGDWRAGTFLTDPATGRALISAEDQKRILFTVFPAIPGELPGAAGTSIVIGTGFGISSSIEPGSAKERAALEVIKALECQEVQLLRLESGSTYPSRTDVRSDALEPLSVAQGEFYAKTSGSFVLDDVFSPKVFSALNAGLREIGLGTSTPEQVAARVQKAYDEWSVSR